MTAADPRVGEIAARLAAHVKCSDCGKCRVAEREEWCPKCDYWTCEGGIACADDPAPADVAFLLAELADRDAKLARVAELHTEDLFRGHLSNGCKTCGNGETGYPCPTAAAVAAATGDGE